MNFSRPFEEQFDEEFESCPWSEATVLYLKWNSIQGDYQLPTHLSPGDPHNRVTIQKLQKVLEMLQQVSGYSSPVPNQCLRSLLIVLGLGAIGAVMHSVFHFPDKMETDFKVFIGGAICMITWFFIVICLGQASCINRVKAINRVLHQAQREVFLNSGVTLRTSPYSSFLIVDFTDPPKVRRDPEKSVFTHKSVGQTVLKGKSPHPIPFKPESRQAKQVGTKDTTNPWGAYRPAPPPLEELDL